MGFSAPRDGRIHLMTLHGDVAGQGRYGPHPAGDIAESGLTYLALGHIHACSGLQRAGETCWAYPGCPEGRGFDETGEKGVLFVTVEDDHTVSARFVPLAGRRYEIVEADVTGKDSAGEALRAVLPPLPHRGLLPDPPHRPAELWGSGPCRPHRPGPAQLFQRQCPGQYPAPPGPVAAGGGGTASPGWCSRALKGEKELEDRELAARFAAGGPGTRGRTPAHENCEHARHLRGPGPPGTGPEGRPEYHHRPQRGGQVHLVRLSAGHVLRHQHQGAGQAGL